MLTFSKVTDIKHFRSFMTLMPPLVHQFKRNFLSYLFMNFMKLWQHIFAGAHLRNALAFGDGLIFKYELISRVQKRMLFDERPRLQFSMQGQIPVLCQLFGERQALLFDVHSKRLAVIRVEHCQTASSGQR